MAVGQVKQLIMLEGVDKASDTVDKVKDSIESLHSANEEGSKKTQEAFGDLEAGLLGISDLLGGLPEPVQRLADNFGGAEKIVGLLPGPLGLVSAGLVVAGGAAYSLFKNLSETQAKLSLLGGERTFALRDKLDLAADDAIKLTQAIDKLPKALQPTDRQFQIIADRAKSMGLEGKDALLGYVEALKEGPEKLIEFEQSFGRLGKIALSLPDIDRQLGISSTAIDAANAVVSALDRAKTLRAEAQTQQIVANQLAADFAAQQEKYAKSSLATREANAGQIRALREQAEVAKELVAAKKREYDQAAATLELEQRREKVAQEFADANTVANAEITKRESEIAFIADKSRRSKAEQVTLGLKLADIERQRVAIQTQLQNKLIDESKAKLALIGLDTQQNALVSANQTAQAEKAKAAAEKAKGLRQAELAAVAKLASAQAEALAARSDDELEVYRARIEAINKQEQADLKAAQGEQATAKAKAAKIQTIQIEAAAKRQKLTDDAIAVELARENETVETDKRVADARLANIDAIRKAQIAAATDPAAKFELQLADLKAQAERKVAEARANGLLTATDVAAREQAIALETAVAVKAAEKEKAEALKQTSEAAAQELQKQIDSASDTVGAAAGVVAAYQGKDGLGTALAETAKQVKAVSAGWADNKDQAGSLIGAVGNVAAAFVDGEREKAGVLAIMNTAQAIAAAATGNIPQAVAFGAAAALYGSIAGGIISTGGAAPSVGGGGFAAGPAAAGGTGGGAGPATTVINFNAPLGTSYEIGKSVVKAQKAASASGYQPAMGMGV